MAVTRACNETLIATVSQLKPLSVNASQYKPQKAPIHDQKSEPGIKKLVGRAGICPKLKNLLLQSERKVEVQLGCDAENRLFAKAFVHSEKPENLVGSYFGAATFVSTTSVRKTDLR